MASVAKQSPKCGQGNFWVRGLPRRFAPRNDNLERLLPQMTKDLYPKEFTPSMTEYSSWQSFKNGGTEVRSCPI
ncbi:hypothetical protein Desti_4534 [Desulfomonile tiedjei DSM 6799]|uniref:Uncharacterized protein n=1 Tax=Desulfomonile tiedjei (strain ATCC 49306 / DSM 6799 / DCB-1) TaxID=706587 RepID=I4CC71_DESTA|nr:hypothetical protein Desti_4534 [Desulfomonile tiedjei DSM 6799]